MKMFDDLPDAREISRRFGGEDGLFSIWYYHHNAGKLDFSNLKLTELPAEIKEYKDITGLNLSRNNLESLPDWIGSFTKLQSLDLRHCGLRSLPESMKKLKNLKELYLGENYLSKLPEWLGSFTKLEKLDISNNGLVIIPDFIGNLKNLISLDLGKSNERENITNIRSVDHLSQQINQMIELPVFLTDLPHLIHLNLGHTALASIPDFLREIRLESLYLNNNELTEIPDWIGSMTTLKNLDLSENRRIESLPDSMEQLVNLEFFNIAKISLKKFPVSISSFFRILLVSNSGKIFFPSILPILFMSLFSFKKTYVKSN